MNWHHLRTVVWLRWRIRVNQVKRQGSLNAIITAIFFFLFLVFAALSFVFTIPLGVFVLGDVRPIVLLLIWDGIVAAFLFSWMIGVVADLQRTESLSADRFLHLPVSLSGVFVVNYISSLVTLTAAAFLPAVFGLSIGLAFSRGPSLLWALPLVAAFFFMISALTYQFRGWLAALMSNPRRRRTIIVFVTMAFVGLAQLPNLLNIWGPWNKKSNVLKINVEKTAEEIELTRQRNENLITHQEFTRRQAEIQRAKQDRLQKEQSQFEEQAGGWLRLANQVLPPGWLPFGVIAAAEGSFFAPALAFAGMSLIGWVSLRRAYRTTIRYYTGAQGKTKPKKVIASPQPVAESRKITSETPTFLEKHIPFLSEHAAAIALGGIRSLLRAPEAKMMLLSPVIMLLIFGSILFREGMEIAKPFRPLTAIGAIVMMLFATSQFIGNQFGFDRSGFRVFVLCPASRRDILLGKNIAMAPFALGLTFVLLIIVQIIRPLHWDHFVALAPQAIAMYLVFCIMGNWLSMLAPMPIAAGTMRPSQPSFAKILVHLLFTLLIPMALAPTLVPWLIEYLVQWANDDTRWPIFLPAALVQLALVGLLYHALLHVQGETLQKRETAILDVVAKKAE